MVSPQAPASQIPLSWAQHLLRFFETLHPGSAFGPSFIINAAYRLRGPLDVNALRRAVSDTVTRHDALRSIITESDGLPWQRVTVGADARLDVLDLTTTGATGADELIDDFLDELDTRHYPAETAPLLWTFLARLGPDDAVLALVAHHSAADASSMGILIRDLAASYEAQLTHQPPPAAAPHYSEYAHEDQAATAHPEAVDYWRRQLNDVPTTSLPTTSSTNTSISKARYRFDIGQEISRGLTTIAGKARCTPFMIHLSAYLILLHKLTDAVDLAVPTLTSGRGQPKTDKLVGFTLNALILRTNLAGDPDITELLTRVRTTCLDAYRHELPVLQLLDDVPDAGLLLADEKFTLLPFQHIPVRARTPQQFGPHCTFEHFQRRPGNRAHSVAAPLDGLWTIHQDSTGSIDGSISYTTNLFTETTIESLANNYLEILQQIATTPKIRITKVRL